MQKDERYYQAYLSHNQISRRGLLRGLFRGGAASHADNHAENEKRQQPRPPFAAKESLFLAACNGCGECVTACPYGLIQLQNGKPMLQIDFVACDFCGECANACSTNALHPAFPADTELRPEFAATCLVKQKQTCVECQQKCPQNAIIFTQNTPNITENCNGCGECQVSCFMGAVKMVEAA